MLHSFSSGDGGSTAGLAQVGSVLYGTTTGGGTGNAGTVFSIGEDGSNYQTLSQLDAIADGGPPNFALAPVGGTLYGTTGVNIGGSDVDGSLYSLSSDGSNFQVVHAFNFPNDPASQPASNVTAGSDGKLYGEAANWGPNQYPGAIYSINPAGTVTLLHGFSYSTPQNGLSPAGGLVLINSTLYGQTLSGGANSDGTVFSLSAGGTSFQVLHSFDGTDGRLEGGHGGGLTQVGSLLYGTTALGGTYDDGVIFSMNLDGSNYQVLHSFSGSQADGGRPTNAALTLAGSTLYGTTTGGGPGDNPGGTVFSIATDGSNFRIVHAFNGEAPAAPVIVAGSSIFGTTQYGGTYGGGTVFSLPITVPGDVNFDGIVNGQDIADVASHWLQTGSSVPGDANGDGIVNGQDIVMIASNWLQAGGAGLESGSAVPEPSAFALLALGGLATLASKRRLASQSDAQADRRSGPRVSSSAQIAPQAHGTLLRRDCSTTAGST